jgi:hypothetical protein
MEAICSSERSVDFQRNTRRYIPEGNTFHNHRCENLKSYKARYVFWLSDILFDFSKFKKPIVP